MCTWFEHCYSQPIVSKLVHSQCIVTTSLVIQKFVRLWAEVCQLSTKGMCGMCDKNLDIKFTYRAIKYLGYNTCFDTTLQQCNIVHYSNKIYSYRTVIVGAYYICICRGVWGHAPPGNLVF